jgi:hypothetical protein
MTDAVRKLIEKAEKLLDYMDELGECSWTAYAIDPKADELRDAIKVVRDDYIFVEVTVPLHVCNGDRITLDALQDAVINHKNELLVTHDDRFDLPSAERARRIVGEVRSVHPVPFSDAALVKMKLYPGNPFFGEIVNAKTGAVTGKILAKKQAADGTTVITKMQLHSVDIPGAEGL